MSKASIVLQSYGTKPCRTCGEPIKSRAIKCIHCNSFQDWRSIFGMSNTALSLLVALASVLTAAVPVLYGKFGPKKSDFSFAFLMASESSVYILASNQGTRPGIITAPDLLTIVGKDENETKVPLHPNKSDPIEVVAPATSPILTLTMPGDSGPVGTTLVDAFKSTNGPIEFDAEHSKCSLEITYVNFGAKDATKTRTQIDCIALKNLMANLKQHLEWARTVFRRNGPP